MELISNRFQHDSNAILSLNALQLVAKEEIEKKIKSKEYEFEENDCPICLKANDRLLVEKDRYGLHYKVVICKECGLLRVNPRMNQSSYNDFYKNHFRDLYIGTERTTSKYFQSRVKQGELIFNFLHKNYKIPKKGNKDLVIEIGCGAGGILNFFNKKGYRIKGIDLDENYLNYGKNKHGLDLSYGNIKDLKLNQPPRIIIYSHVFEHILDLKSELEELYKICDKNTIIYIEVPGVKNIHRAYRMDSLKYFQNAHVYHFTLSTLCNLFLSSGFDFVQGSEYIKAVFKKSVNQKRINRGNEYYKTIRYLRRIEKLRYIYPALPINLIKKGFYFLRFFPSRIRK